MLPVPSERVRELSEEEEERLFAAVPPDYAPFVAFALTTGLRLAECLLKWNEVDDTAKQIRKPGKGSRLVTAPITSEVRAILQPLRGHHPEFVFTYMPQRPNGSSERQPLTYGGVQTMWRRTRERRS